MSTAQIVATEPLEYANARAIYRRLCEKAKRTHNRDGVENQVRFNAVCALQNEWDFNQSFPLSDLKHLPLDERREFLELINHILTTNYYPASFERISRETIGEL